MDRKVGGGQIVGVVQKVGGVKFSKLPTRKGTLVSKYTLIILDIYFAPMLILQLFLQFLSKKRGRQKQFCLIPCQLTKTRNAWLLRICQNYENFYLYV